MTATPFPAWDDCVTAGMDEAALLLYRSNLLGSGLRITNYGGGNTGAKVMLPDPVSGVATEVLLVKGSGGDLGSMKMDGFSSLYPDKLNGLKQRYRGPEFDDEMVGYLPRWTLNLNPRAASIDTPLHAYLPFKHTDHMHPDALIAIAAMANSEQVTKEIFGGAMGWVEWRRPSDELGLILENYVKTHPGLRGLVMAGHGVFTWGDTARSCYQNTVQVIGIANAWLEKKSAGKPAFCGHKLAHVDRSDAVGQFVNSQQLEELAAPGTSCPDHFLRTRIRPLVLPEATWSLERAELRAALAAPFAYYGTNVDQYARIF